jgi:hypothetical protein
MRTSMRYEVIKSIQRFHREIFLITEYPLEKSRNLLLSSLSKTAIVSHVIVRKLLSKLHPRQIGM